MKLHHKTFPNQNICSNNSFISRNIAPDKPSPTALYLMPKCTQQNMKSLLRYQYFLVMSPSKAVETGEIRTFCFICEEPASLQCEQCKEVFYCCSDHGRLHHSDGACFPYKVKLSDGQRCLVTTRDVAMGLCRVGPCFAP